MTTHPSEAASSMPKNILLSTDPEKERKALLCLVAFLLDQLGGSVALSSAEAMTVFDINNTGTAKRVEFQELKDPWTFIFKVIDDDK